MRHPIKESCAKIGEIVQGIINGKIKKIDYRILNTIDNCVNQHFSEWEKRIADEEDVLPVNMQMLVACFDARIEDFTLEKKVNSSRYKSHSQDMLREVMYRFKSPLSDFLKTAGPIQICGRTPQTYDRRGGKIVVADPASPLIDFIGLFEHKKIDEIGSLLGGWLFPEDITLEKAFINYVKIKWRDNLTGFNKKLIDLFCQDYWNLYQKNNYLTIKGRSKLLAKNYMNVHYASKCAEIFGQYLPADYIQNLDEFEYSLPLSKAQRKKHQDNLTSLIIRENAKTISLESTDNYREAETIMMKLGKNPLESFDKYFDLSVTAKEIAKCVDSYHRFIYRPTNWYQNIINKIARTFQVPNGLNDIDLIRSYFNDEINSFNGSAFFSRKDFTEGHKRAFLFNDIFVPIYQELFEPNDLEAIRFVDDSLLHDPYWDHFGEKITIGPRRLEYRKYGRTDTKIVAAAQKVLFPKESLSYTSVVQKWNNAESQLEFFELRKLRAKGKIIIPRNIRKDFDGWFYVNSDKTHFILSKNDINLEIITGLIKTHTQFEHFFEQVETNIDSINSVLKQTRAETAVNRSPTERGVSVMELLLSSSTKPAGSILEFTDFPQETIVGLPIIINSLSRDHLRKNNIDYPKQKNGYQCIKYNFKSFELIIVNPRMLWDQTYGRSSHGSNYKADLIEQTINDAKKLYGETKKKEVFVTLQLFLEIVKDKVAVNYMNLIEKNLQNLHGNSNKESILKNLEHIDNLYQCLCNDFPGDGLNKTSIKWLKNSADIKEYLSKKIPEALEHQINFNKYHFKL